jgi:hypothetical protein
LKKTFIAFLLAAAMLCPSCSGRKAPEPPKTRPELLLEIYASISKGDHKGALNKVLRLREIDKTSVFLTELESIERNNMYLVEARRLLVAGDIAAATELLDGAIKRHGQHDELVSARSDIASLSEISALIDVISSPKSSAALKEASAKLVRLAPSFNPAAPFTAFAEEKARQAASLERFETTMTLFDLCSDADILAQSGNPDVCTLFAELAIEDSDNPALKGHLSKIALAPGARLKIAKK